MAAIVMDGKALAAKIKEQVRLQVERMERKPGMAMVLVGENPAAQVYEEIASSAASTTRPTACRRTCPSRSCWT